jgi:hypothetical protein
VLLISLTLLITLLLQVAEVEVVMKAVAVEQVDFVQLLQQQVAVVL